MTLPLSKYVPAPNNIMLDVPIVKMTVGKSETIKPDTVVQKEKMDWVDDGKPLLVAKDFVSSDGKLTINKGQYILLKNIMGMKSFNFEEGEKWELPITSYAGHFDK